MTPAPRRRGNLLALGLTRAIVAISGFIVQVALIRMLPRQAYADYNWVWAIVAVTTFGATGGIPILLTRRISRDQDQAPRLLAAALRAVAVCSMVTGVLIVAYITYQDGRTEVRLAGVIGAATLAVMAAGQMAQSAVHGVRRMFLEVPAILASRLVFLVGHLVLLYGGYGLVHLYGVRFATALVLCLGLLASFVWKVGPLEGGPGEGLGRQLLWEGRPFAATMFFGGVYAQADILLLQLLTDHVEVARYVAPARVLLQAALVANVLSRGFYPRLAQLKDDPAAAGAELRFLTRSLLLGSLPILVGGVVLAEPLIRLVSEAYMDAWGPFLFLLAAMPVRFLNNGYGLALAAFDQERVRMRIDMLGAVLNVGLNLVFIPVYGALGAAATTLATDVVLNVCLQWRLRRSTVGFGLFSPLRRAAAPALVMGGVLMILPEMPVLAAVMVGVLVYAAASFLTGAISVADLRRLARV